MVALLGSFLTSVGYFHMGAWGVNVVPFSEKVAFKLIGNFLVAKTKRNLN